MTVEMTRTELCDLRLACTNIIIATMNEIRDPETSDTRREIAERTLKKWQTLKDKIILQTAEQDGETEI